MPRDPYYSTGIVLDPGALPPGAARCGPGGSVAAGQGPRHFVVVLAEFEIDPLVWMFSMGALEVKKIGRREMFFLMSVP